MGSNRRVAQLSAIEFEEIAQRTDSLILVPVGATEQHGPHLPLAVDSLLSEAVAAGVAQQIDGYVAPGIIYGYKSQPRSGGGNHRSGTISVSATTLMNQTRDLANEYFRHGFNYTVFINGHFENYQFLYEGLDLSVSDQRDAQSKQAALLSYWDFVSDEVLETVFPEGFKGWEIEHGGVLETSLMMYLFPDLVAEELFPDHPPAEQHRLDIFPERTDWTPESGSLSSPSGSSSQKGQLIYESVVEEIAEEIMATLRGTK